MPNDELKVQVGVELDMSEAQKQLNDFKGQKDNKIKFKVDINNIKEQLASLSNTKSIVKITVDVLKGVSNSNISNYIKEIQAKYQASPIKLAFDVDKNILQKNLKAAMEGIQQTTQRAAQEAVKQAQKEAQEIKKNANATRPSVVPDRYVKDAENYGKLQRTTTISTVSKDEEGNKLITPHTAIDQYKRDIGEVVTVVQQLKESEEEEGKVWEEVSHTVTENFEKRAAEIEKINIANQRLIEKSESAWAKQVNKNADKARKETEARQKEEIKTQEDYTKLFVQSREKQAKEEEAQRKKEEAQIKKNAKEEEQYTKLFIQAREKQAKIDQQEAKIENKRDQDYDKLFGEASRKDLATRQKAVSDIEKSEREINEIEKEAFSGTYALTGKFKDEAVEQIKSVREELAKLKSDAAESYQVASGVSSVNLKSKTDILSNDIGRLKKIEYPGDKMAAVNIDVKKAFASESLDEMQKKLEKLGMSTSEFTDKIIKLRDGMKELGKVDSDQSAWANWRTEMQTLEQDIAKFEKSTQGKSKKLAIDIDDSQVKQIQNTMNMLNNIDQKYSGTGVEAVKQSLQSLSQEYQQVMTQLKSDTITDDQFTQLSERIKELDAQLKQAVDSVKIFQDGVKNESTLRKFDETTDGLRMKFEQLKSTYEQLSKLNPDIANKFNDVQEKLNGIDPTNVQEVSKAINNLTKECQIASGQMSGLRGALESAFGGVGQYIARFASAFYIINKTTQVIRSMVNEVKNLDSALVSLQKVTGLTGNALASFTESAYDAGRELGRTGQDVIEATATFSRAGYSLQEATELAKSALVMTNVGVDIDSTEAAASDMISILKAFDIQAEESMEVIDKLYNVSNKEPLDFGNLTQMLVTAGGTLAQTGTTLEETMALLTGGFATLRNSSVANGLMLAHCYSNVA